MLRFLMVLCLCSCSLRTVNKIGLTMQTAALACDWGQTRSFASEDWRGGHREQNPFMGEKPPADVVDMYFFGVAGVAALGWYALPPKLRPVLSGLIVLVQASAIRNNLNVTSLCAL